jgi:hypothetical protein
MLLHERKNGFLHTNQYKFEITINIIFSLHQRPAHDRAPENQPNRRHYPAN